MVAAHGGGRGSVEGAPLEEPGVASGHMAASTFMLPRWLRGCATTTRSTCLCYVLNTAQERELIDRVVNVVHGLDGNVLAYEHDGRSCASEICPLQDGLAHSGERRGDRVKSQWKFSNQSFVKAVADACRTHLCAHSSDWELDDKSTRPWTGLKLDELRPHPGTGGTARVDPGRLGGRRSTDSCSWPRALSG